MTTNINKKYIENNFEGASKTVLLTLLNHGQGKYMRSADIAKAISDVPAGTVSSRLSVAKADGLIESQRIPGTKEHQWALRQTVRNGAVKKTKGARRKKSDGLAADMATLRQSLQVCLETIDRNKELFAALDKLRG